MNADLEKQLQELLDKQAIYELIAAYCNAADRHDFAKMRALYHEDAIDEHGRFAKGPAREFLDRLPDIQAPMAILHHNVTTVNLKLDGNYAEGEVYLIAMHQVREGDALYDVLIGGRYFASTRSATASGSSCTAPSLPTGPIRRRRAASISSTRSWLAPTSVHRARAIRPTVSSSCCVAANASDALARAARRA